jgi:hypothetical protein
MTATPIEPPACWAVDRPGYHQSWYEPPGPVVQDRGQQQEQGKHEEERGHDHLVGQADDHPGAECPLPEQLQVDQRGTTAGGQPALAQCERAKQRDGGCQADDDPGGPPLLLPLHKRQHDRDEAE